MVGIAAYAEPPVASRIASTVQCPKSGSIARPDFRPERVISGMDAAKAAAALIWATFPGRSENEVCAKAAMALGASDQTIRRILHCETKDASWRVMSRCMVFLAGQGKDPLAVIGNAALSQIMRAAMQLNQPQGGPNEG